MNFGTVIAVAIAAFCFLNRGDGAERPPNVVVFLLDDLGARDVGCYGSSFYETPNIDRLAAGGMRFTAAYSTCPVCSPTRSSMMTGRYPQRTGITDYINAGGGNQPEQWQRNTRLLPASYSDHLALEERTIAEELHDKGYATFFAGKWHLGGDGFLPTDQGFDDNRGGTNSGQPASYYSPYNNRKLADGPAGESLSMRLGKETCKFIDTNRDKPFLVYLSFFAVHVPLQARDELIKKYEAKAAASKNDGPEFGNEGKSKLRLEQRNATYAGMIEEMDDAVGMVLDKLDELGLAKNTIVLFTSDNGGLSTAEGWSTSNLPLRGGKGWMYEGGIRVVSIIRWPGVVKAGSECATPIMAADYFPTFVTAARAKVDSALKIDGVDIGPLLRGDKTAERTLYWDYPHYGNQGGAPGSAVREGKWKLIEWREGGALELYDLDADPSEKHNLAQDQPEVAKRLREKLASWRKEVGAKEPGTNPNFDPSKPINREPNRPVGAANRLQ